MQFPRAVYRCPGPHHGPPGHTYESKSVPDANAHHAALQAGWHASLPAACGLVPSLVPAPVASLPEDDDAPPSRHDLEAQALKMGLKFDGRTSDAKLARMIDEAI